MSTSIGPTYDPPSTAAAMAQKYTSGLQATIDAQTKQANAVSKGLGDLSSAILAYQASLSSLTGLNKTMSAHSATFSDTTLGSATASASATAGTYGFFVKQIATASQVSYSGLVDDTGVGGNLVVKLGASTSFTVDLAAANTDGGALSPREIAAAINAAAGNTSLVTASVVNTGTTSELVLSAKNTGAASAITLDTAGVTGTSSLATANATPASIHQLVAAQDAEIHVGTEAGTPIIQASNTFTNIDGVSMTFTRAQPSGAAPVTLTVGPDDSATTANVQAFVDAFNKLKSTVDAMTDAGDPSKGVGGGVFAHDSGIRALRDRLVSLMRPSGATSLASYGILAARDGSLSLDSARLTRQLAANPKGLDTLIGSTSASAPSGIASAVDSFLKSWSNSIGGQIQQRQTENDRLQQDLTSRQADLDNTYNAAYSRYLLQFTQLQTLQSQMSSNTSMFDALFGNNSKSN
jgi:flagellar hook-associated protein 2